MFKRLPKKKIIAVDFDGTLCTNKYPAIGKPKRKIIDLVKQLHPYNTLILWTCRCNEDLAEALDWCAAHGLHFHYVNENVPENTEKYQNNSRKIYADIYIDDKAVNVRDIHRRKPNGSTGRN